MLSESSDPLFDDEDERLLDEEDDELLEFAELLPPLLGLLACEERLRAAEEPELLERVLDADARETSLLDLRALLLDADGRELRDAVELACRVLELEEEEATFRLDADDEAEGFLRALDPDAELVEVRLTTVRGSRRALDATEEEERVRADSREREAEDGFVGARLAVTFDLERERWSLAEFRLPPLNPRGLVGCDVERETTADDDRCRACVPRELEAC